MNLPEKRRILLHDLQRLGIDVAYIQETHFREDKTPTLKNRKYPIAYHATNQEAKSRGVSILIAGRIQWTYVDSMRDPKGRYLFVKGKIGGIGVTFATVYVPNEHQGTFLDKTIKRLLEFTEGHLIMGGDLNIPLDPKEDTSSGKSSTSFSVRNHIMQTLYKSQLIDIWRLLHNKERDYTFYSAPHKIYSRIDLFLIPHAQLHSVQSTKIGSITWSDHAPIFLVYELKDLRQSRPNQWRLNESLLEDKEVLEDVIKELRFYFNSNDTPECDPGIIWEAHKVVIRGVLIKHGSRIKRKRTEKLNRLLKELAILEGKHKQTWSTNVEKELASKRTEITDLLYYKVKAAMQRCKKAEYESGNKCGKRLARLLREQKLSNYIPHINSPKKHRVTKPNDITKEFQEYYNSLYNIQSKPPTREQIDLYLTESAIPRLSEEDRQKLDDVITEEEIKVAVSIMKRGKAPGPDGFTGQYYKILFPSISGYMVKLFNALGTSASLAKDTLLAYISVIPKEGKDPALCGSYRPISLLNSDVKIFAKVLANRIQQHIPDLINLDQVGFVPTREARDNTIKAINLVQLANSTQTQCVFLNTDAEKAFDRVRWSYMRAVLKYGGFGNKIIQWIFSMYSGLTAQVRANGILSEPLTISNGTRQGCPLSPLLFALSLEPFLCTLRANSNISGIQIGKNHCKITAYADDMLFSLTNR